MSEQPQSENKIRSTSLYPDAEMESVYLNIMGIEGDREEVLRQKEIAKGMNVDWLIFLREASEEVNLLKWSGTIQVHSDEYALKMMLGGNY